MSDKPQKKFPALPKLPKTDQPIGAGLSFLRPAPSSIPVEKQSAPCRNIRQ